MNDSKTTSRGHRIWIPISLVVLATVGITAIQLQSEMDRNFRSWAVTVTILLTGVLTVLWFALLSRIRWKVRLISLAVLALVALGLSKLVRVNGTVDGRGLPRLAWKWSTEPARHFTSLPMTAMATNPPVAAARADITDVPQFFGPNRDGIVHGAKLARDWSAQPPRELWRQAIGEGWSAFAVVGGRAFTQEQRGDAELVTCYELLTGHLLWAHTNVVRFSEWQGGDGPRATPTINGGKLFAIGGTGILDCLDADDGRRLWSRDVLRENQLPNLIWGVSCSPLVFDDAVVVSGGFTNGPMPPRGSPLR